MEAYSACLSATSTKTAPWYVVPADDKKTARLIISSVVLDTLEGLKMTYPPLGTQRREERAEKVAAKNQATPEVEDVSVFPMAMPMLAGPGAIAAIMLLMNEADTLEETGAVLGALGAVLVLTMLALIAAGPLIRLLGDRVGAVITRLLGVLLAALAAQYVIDGLRGAFGV